MVCAIFKQKRLDCVPLVLCICNFMDFIRITATSHTIQGQYTGQGLILLENAELRDTEGEQISCVLSGKPYAHITWKWKDDRTPPPEQYFSWTTNEIPTDPKLSSSTLRFAKAITEAQKREIKTRTIYAIGAHTNDSSKTKQCDDVILSFIWKAEKPSLSIDKETFVIGKDTEAQLTCQLIDKGIPEGQVRWIKNGNLQSESEYSTEIISIPVIKDIDDDQWQCYYFNTAGDGHYSDEVLINVHWSPGGATISADTQTPKRDDTFTFTCTGDRGNPPRRVLWYLSGTMVANTTNKQYTVTDAKESHNGNWSCIFNNYLKSGAQSQSIQIQVQLTPEQGEVRITSITARNVVVNATPKTNTQKARRSIRSTTITNMIITWYSDNDQNNTVLVPPDTTQYALYNLTANTNYTIEVSYVNDQGIGAAATAYVTTKALPINIDPIITRRWLSAVVTLDIANPGSVAQVEMLVCGSVEDMNCANKSINDVQTGNLEAKISSINGRYVIVSLYDEGFLISMYSDNIDAPVLAITLIVLGTLLVVVAVCVVIVVIIRKTRTSTPTEKSELYENVGADKRSVPGGVNNVKATPDYEYVTHNAASTSNNTESSTYMGLDQTSLQRTKERATELTVYQSLN